MSICSKLLVPWIEHLCDNGLFLDLIRWVDKSKKIFFLSWIHKSSANWNPTKSDVFKEWAAYKRKLGEKDDRDFKAAFRNALKSKKDLLKLVDKGKEHRCWQILSQPIKQSRRNATNTKEKKPRQKRAAKKSVKRCQPQSEDSFQDPPPPSSCSSVINDEICFPSTSHQSLPPCQSLFHVSPPSTPLQQSDVIFTDIDEQPDFDCLFRTLQISAPTDSMSELINEIPPVVIHSTPHSPAQRPMCVSPYGIPPTYVNSSPQSPVQRSRNEVTYGSSLPNAHSNPQSPVQMSMSGIPSPYVDSNPGTPAGSEPIHGMSSPYSSPRRPSQRSVTVPLSRISSPYIDSSPQSPTAMSTGESFYEMPPLNVYSNPISPAQALNVYSNPISPAQALNVYSNPISPAQGSEAQYAVCNSPVSFSNALTGWMSPEQEVPAMNFVDLLNATSEVEQHQPENQDQEFFEELYRADFYQVREKEDLAPAKKFLETSLVHIEQAHQVLLNSPNELISSLSQFNSERQLLEHFVNLESEKL